MPKGEDLSEHMRAKVDAERDELRKDTLLPLIWARDAGAMLDTGYVIKGVIGCGELIVIYGPPKSGKTFLATDLALCVAAYQMWFGHRVKAGLVIYIASEMGARVQRRVRAWLDHHMGDAAETSPPLAIVPQVLNLLDELQVERLIATLDELTAEYGRPVLIIVDTLARSMIGGDENSALDMGRALAVGDRLRDRYNAATLFVHHSGKDASKGGRGSSALLGAADGYIRVEADDSGNRTATIEWSRDGESGQQYGFRLRRVELGTDVDGEQVSTCIVEASTGILTQSKPRKLPAGAQLAHGALREAIDEFGETMPGTSSIPPGVRAVGLDKWRRRYYVKDGLDADSDDAMTVKQARRARETRFRRARIALLNAGNIGACNDLHWIL